MRRRLIPQAGRATLSKRGEWNNSSITSTRHDPRGDYTRHLDARRRSLAEVTRQHIRFGNLRVATILSVLVTAYLAIARDLLPGWSLLVPIVALVWVSVLLDRAVNARTRFGRSVAFYERALGRLDGRWSGTGSETGERFLNDEHLYARDLDLFGDASLFELLNGARTRMGEATLADWLKTPADAADVRKRQDAIIELAPRTDLREDLAVLGEDTRAGVNAEALAAWGERPPRLESSAPPVWAWLLTVAGILAACGLVAWLASLLRVLTLDNTTQIALRSYVIAVFAIAGLVLWRSRPRTEGILHDVEEAARDLGLLAGVLRRLEAERFASARLSEVRAQLDVNGQPPSRRIARLDLIVSLVDSRHHFLVRLAGPLVLFDLHLAYAVERWRRTSGTPVRRWLDAVAEMEALSSIAGYHYEHPDDVFPKLEPGEPCFDGDALAHPLLPEGVAVRNDVHLCGELRVVVVSGSNMSGKSTLLRTVGINTVLAQAGAPVRARRLRLSPLGIGASIRIQDSLHAGVSRFYAEIMRIGQVMRRANETPPVLFLVDELLHGTNSHDRRIGAEAIVRGLVERGAIGLVTTHDLALAHVADALGPRGANVHFQDVIENGQIHFDYRMRPGVVQKSNALELMRSVGLDV